MQRLAAKYCTNFVAFSNMKRVGVSQYVPQLPQFQLNPEAVRPATRNDKDVRLSQYSSLTNFKRSYDQIPQCRYYAVEYRNRIHHVFNAYCYPMGRMINKIATVIRGKNTPHYKNSIANVKNGDVCIIVNAMDPLLTGKKLKFKNLKYHTNFVGHLKTFSYRSILNKKPELLYYYLLRKAMPKTKISSEYLCNVKIFRGPNHNIKDLPQFMPPKQMLTPLSEINLKQYVASFPDQEIKIVSESEPGLTQKILNRKLEYQTLPQDDKTLNVDDSLDTEPKKRKVNKYSQQELQKFKRRQKAILYRYKDVRAPYRKNRIMDQGFTLFESEKEAKKSPFYELMADDEMVEDQDFKVDDPLLRKGWEKQKDPK